MKRGQPGQEEHNRALEEVRLGCLQQTSGRDSRSDYSLVRVPLPDLEGGIRRYDHAPNVRVHNKFDELAEEEEMTKSPPPPAALTIEPMTARR